MSNHYPDITRTGANVVPQPSMSDDGMKLSQAHIEHIVQEAERRIRDRSAYEYQVHQQMEKRSAAIRQEVLTRVQDLTRFAVYRDRVERMKTSSPGAKLTEQAQRTYRELEARAKTSAEELVDAVVDGQDAKDGLMAQLLQAAAEDPGVGAAAIEAESPEAAAGITPEIVEELAEQIADAADTESPDGMSEKESSERREKISTVLNSFPPLGQMILKARARTKLSERAYARTQARGY